MATTWIKALHRSGGIAAALGRSVDYTEDADKTNDGDVLTCKGVKSLTPQKQGSHAILRHKVDGSAGGIAPPTERTPVEQGHFYALVDMGTHLDKHRRARSYIQAHPYSACVGCSPCLSRRLLACS